LAPRCKGRRKHGLLQGIERRTEMFRRLLQAIVLVPLAGALVGWAVANRQSVVVSFDPFDSADPAYAITVPVYLLGFAILIVGVVLGGIATWLRQRKWRRARARLAAEIDVVRAELEQHRRHGNLRDSRAVAPTAGAVAKRPPEA
jgi:hypothetical protein